MKSRNCFLHKLPPTATVINFAATLVPGKFSEYNQFSKEICRRNIPWAHGEIYEARMNKSIEIVKNISTRAIQQVDSVLVDVQPHGANSGKINTWNVLPTNKQNFLKLPGLQTGTTFPFMSIFNNFHLSASLRHHLYFHPYYLNSRSILLTVRSIQMGYAASMRHSHIKSATINFQSTYRTTLLKREMHSNTLGVQ